MRVRRRSISAQRPASANFNRPRAQPAFHLIEQPIDGSCSAGPCPAADRRSGRPHARPFDRCRDPLDERSPAPFRPDPQAEHERTGCAAQAEPCGSRPRRPCRACRPHGTHVDHRHSRAAWRLRRTGSGFTYWAYATTAPPRFVFFSLLSFSSFAQSGGSYSPLTSPITALQNFSPNSVSPTTLRSPSTSIFSPPST
jgi:hypothetical protein